MPRPLPPSPALISILTITRSSSLNTWDTAPTKAAAGDATDTPAAVLDTLPLDPAIAHPDAAAVDADAVARTHIAAGAGPDILAPAPRRTRPTTPAYCSHEDESEATHQQRGSNNSPRGHAQHQPMAVDDERKHHHHPRSGQGSHSPPSHPSHPSQYSESAPTANPPACHARHRRVHTPLPEAIYSPQTQTDRRGCGSGGS